MGSLCSKSSNEPSSDNFSSPGRIVGSVPSAAPSNQRAQIPRTTTGGRTLGGSGGSGGAAADDARSAAAKAAEVFTSTLSTTRPPRSPSLYSYFFIRFSLGEQSRPLRLTHCPYHSNEQHSGRTLHAAGGNWRRTLRRSGRGQGRGHWRMRAGRKGGGGRWMGRGGIGRGIEV